MRAWSMPLLHTQSIASVSGNPFLAKAFTTFASPLTEDTHSPPLRRPPDGSRHVQPSKEYLHACLVNATAHANYSFHSVSSNPFLAKAFNVFAPDLLKGKDNNITSTHFLSPTTPNTQIMHHTATSKLRLQTHLHTAVLESRSPQPPSALTITTDQWSAVSMQGVPLT